MSLVDNCHVVLVIANQFTDATVSVSPAPLPAYPATNMLMTWRSRVMRTRGITNQRITFTLQAPRRANAFFCPVDGAVELRLELFADATLTSRVYDSGVTRFGVPVQSIIPWGTMRYGIHAWGATASTQVGYARALYFPDTDYIAGVVTMRHTNPNAAYIEVPYVVIGSAFAPVTGASTGVTLAIRNQRKQQRTRGGTLLRTGAPVQWRELSIALDMLTEAERNRLFTELSATGGEAALVDVYPKNTTALHDHHIFMADIELPEFTHESGNRHSTKLRFIEV